MKLFVVLTFCALASYSYAIHNGEVVKPNSIPYQVLLLVHRDGKTSKCGGSLIKADRVLTAAHCLKDRDYAEVFVGAHHLHDRNEKTRQSQRVEPSGLIPHPSWDGIKLGYDVGIVKLSKPFELNENVALIKLPYGLKGESFVNETAKITGWGEIDNEHDHVGPLRAVENPIITNKECVKHIKIDSSNVCMSGEGERRTCKGDSGGPLVIKSKGEIVQIGLVSKGEGSCGGVHPSVFTRVTHYLDDFIKDNLS